VKNPPKATHLDGQASNVPTARQMWRIIYLICM